MGIAIRPLKLYFDRWGIEFPYKGEQLIWVWPWRIEEKGKPFYSLSFEGYFSSLKALDKEWEEYWEACKPWPEPM